VEAIFYYYILDI